MSVLKDVFYLAYVASADSSKPGNLFPHLNLLSFRQFCRTLVLAPCLLMGNCLFLKARLQLQGHLDAYECVPSFSCLVMPKHKLERLFFIERVFNAVYFPRAL